MRVFIYSEERGFGGHEILTCLGAEALLDAGFCVAFAYNDENLRLAKKLTNLEHKGLMRLPMQVSVKRMQYIRSPFEFNKIKKIRDAIVEFSASIVIVSQGRIESGTSGYFAARKAGVNLAGYIPMAHSVCQLQSNKLIAFLKDCLNRIYYSMPDGYITISAGIARQLREMGVTSHVSIVANPVLLGNTSDQKRVESGFRKRYGIGEKERLVVQIARIDFFQKRQDWLLRVVKQQLNQLDGVKFVIVGDGPDSALLDKLRSDLGLEDRVVVIPWVECPAAIYNQADIVLLTSRYEGVPLTMLDALYARVPVVAPSIEGVQDWLPECWLYNADSGEEMVRIIRDVLETSPINEINCIRERLNNECSRDGFKWQFELAVKQLIELRS